MLLPDPTRIQHFVSQAEQRLNTFNPNAKPKKQRIYSFLVEDRESHFIRLENDQGCRIGTNLSMHDLFTVDVSDGIGNTIERYNFEAKFCAVERDLPLHTNNLLAKLSNGDDTVSVEVVNLFKAKLLNFARNPFCITKILNTFGVLANYRPLDASQSLMFDRILTGRRPQQASLCSSLGISDADYERWLKALFMLFVPSQEDGRTILDDIALSLFTQPLQAVMVCVCTYTEAKCLLSDRSFSLRLDEPGIVGMDFNLRSDAFISYVFADIARLLPNFDPELIRRYRELPRGANVDLRFLHDDIAQLRSFNRHTIYQCHQRVFCADHSGFPL